MSEAPANTLQVVSDAGSLSPRLFSSDAPQMLEGVKSVQIPDRCTNRHAALVARYSIEPPA
ncbi:MAG TPA: hypothetical protein VMV33_04975 [Rhodocyclaceae bacterium]|nr:hypothetical protein [Rhodocyclaceae bacterium]